jgi:hypothetical protein
MSTITVTNIKATGETASRVVSGVAAAWVNFNGTGTIATRDSNNVSSLTDNGTGRYEINLTSSFSAVEYTGAGFSAGGLADGNYSESIVYLKTTGTYFQRAHWQTTMSDLAYVGSQVFGDLA